MDSQKLESGQICSAVRVSSDYMKTEQQILSEDRKKQRQVLFLSFCFESFVFLRWAGRLFWLVYRFFFPTSVWPFYFYFPPVFSAFLTFRLCAWLSLLPVLLSFSLALIHLLPLTPSLSAAFHLFLYLSQWELMWPLCAVSSLRGRQSSSAPIRTALSGAVSTTGLPTHASIYVRHPPPTSWEVER